MKQPEPENTAQMPTLMSIYKPCDQDWFMLAFVDFPVEVCVMESFALLEGWGMWKNSHVWLDKWFNAIVISNKYTK